MNPAVKEKWLKALRGGDYTQGHHRLHDVKADAYCCLGVLCDLAARDGVVLEEPYGVFIDPSGISVNALFELPGVVRVWAGLENADPMIGDAPASVHNDVFGESFAAIADLIEEHL